MRAYRPTRTIALAGWAVLAAAALSGPARAAEPVGVRRLTVVVRETAGIRRFGYPVSAVLSLPDPVKDAAHFRLLENGKPVAAQFQPSGDGGKGVRSVALDFTSSPGPNEKRTYVVEYGPAVKPPEPVVKGLEVATEDEQFRVAHASGLVFLVPRRLTGLLSGVKAGRDDYLRPGSTGLVIRARDGTVVRAGGTRAKPPAARVVKQGPLAAALRFEGSVELSGGRPVKSVVQLDFPRSKSWVQVTWTIDDPEGLVAGLGADVNVRVRGEPTLVDFGAGSLVYAALRKGQAARLEVRDEPATQRNGRISIWETLVGKADALRPYVVGRGTPAEGWAHVMDRKFCTAAAVADFAKSGQRGTISVDADGRLRLWKEFVRKGEKPAAGRKALTFWLHFVTMPVQVGAATSPQAMLAPLRVEVRPRN